MVYRPYRRSGISPIWVLIGVNFVIFIATRVNPGLILDRFGFSPYRIVQDWWTVFTYMFVHYDIWHILFNMIALYFFGTMVMSLIGETAFLATYFVGGIMGALMFYVLSFALNSSQYAIVIGASGAIYALGGLLLVMRPNIKVMMFPLPIPMPLWVAILIGFVLVSFYANVAWQAHLGGLLFGAAVGYYYRQKEYRRY
jgi:membrane associated rhomboid family serine protease